MIAALRRFDEPENVAREVGFPVPSQTFERRRKKGDMVALDRRRAKKLIRPENAAILVDHLPESEWDRTHAVVCGDFIFGDFIAQVLDKLGPCPRLDIATLSMSAANAQMLGATLQSGRVRGMRVVLSHYFRATNPEVIKAIEEHLAPAGCEIIIGRCHCKLALFDYPSQPLVFESSANLRSSNCMEQVTILCDRELLDFHRGIMDTLAAIEGEGNKGGNSAKFTAAEGDT